MPPQNPEDNQPSFNGGGQQPLANVVVPAPTPPQPEPSFPQSQDTQFTTVPPTQHPNAPYVSQNETPLPQTNKSDLFGTTDTLNSTSPDPVVPTPVVQVLSPRGVEYVMLTIALFTAAIGLTAILLCLVNGQTGLMSLSLPVSLLIVGLPIFAGLFLRLKKAELNNPSLKLDQSKRRSTQTTQIISFVVSLFTVVGLLVSIFAAISGSAGDVGKGIASALITLIIFGGILAYYWWDEHRS